MKDRLETFLVGLLMIAVFAGLYWLTTRQSAPEPPRIAEPTLVCMADTVFVRQKPSPTAKTCHQEADSQESFPPAGICWADPAGEGEICTYWLADG